ncbi:MAG TPA: tRNA (N(6)-L-threonylcarbamoyladenosine(37)-C(2))-methylthiotransferase [Methanotrichaceae archaeon]|nr:tRNA (N(6)-L-threonylcarbamoyladenosine(37)-C(2))-methylthiotransferase [Methanotrichaceae archaeon]
MKFHIETYGCTANFGNSREAEAALIELGHTPATIEEADLVIVNTCAVTEKTERKIIARLRQIQGRRLVLSGCLPSALPRAAEGIDCLMKLGILDRASALKIAGLMDAKAARTESLPAPRIDLCGIVNIAEGCPGRCSYCIVRKARGRLVSRPTKDVVHSVIKLVQSGIMEVQLACQDAAAYGADIGTSLPALLREISGIPGRFKVRIGMMKPDSALPILEDLISALCSPRMYRFLHVPVQSGSDRVLEAMSRGYSADDFLKMAERLRESMPDIGLITDVIAGFPGEEEDDFRATMDLMKAVQPDKINITRFSRRPGTPAARLYDMPDRIKKDRSRELTRLWLEIASARNRVYEGRTLDVLVTERGRNGTLKARCENYTGVVLCGAADLGGTIQARVVGSNPFYITAKAVRF